MKTYNYQQDKVTGMYHPAQYPGEKSTDWVLPDDIRSDFGKLNSVIETKYTREYLKICAFYNKLFPSLKYSQFVRSTYNVAPFTSMDQEHSDTGTGISSNYLKQIIDQTVSRLGTVAFDAALLADVPTLEYIIYRDEVERLLRKVIRSQEMSTMTMECFHDAAIVGYSHIFIDPFTDKIVKASDYEIGMFEPQFNRGAVRQMLYRDYAFPTTELVPYLVNASEELKDEIIEGYGANTIVDFKIYFDCPAHKAYATIHGTTLPAIDYPFDTVQVETFSWDIGFSKVTTTSLFDLLYPVQRELNKVNAKLQQLIRMYKGAVPVFNSDVDLAMKAISNGTGEALYVDSSRPIDTLMTVINPTPLDAALSAEKTNYKTEMYELAGIQQASFDMENMRSAAAVIALDQTRDSVFQAQLAGLTNFIARVFRMFVRYNAAVNNNENDIAPWAQVQALLDSAVVDLKPIHVNDPMGNKGTMAETPKPDFQAIQIARKVIMILKGTYTWDDVNYLVDKQQLKLVAAAMMQKLDALSIEIPEPMQQFMVAAFIDDVQAGVVPLNPPMTTAPGAEGQAA